MLDEDPWYTNLNVSISFRDDLEEELQFASEVVEIFVMKNADFI